MSSVPRNTRGRDRAEACSPLCSRFSAPFSAPRAVDPTRSTGERDARSNEWSGAPAFRQPPVGELARGSCLNDERVRSRRLSLGRRKAHSTSSAAGRTIPVLRYQRWRFPRRRLRPMCAWRGGSDASVLGDVGVVRVADGTVVPPTSSAPSLRGVMAFGRVDPSQAQLQLKWLQEAIQRGLGGIVTRVECS
jgi:hypothetical protein